MTNTDQITLNVPIAGPMAIRTLNDLLRKMGIGGRTVLTRSVSALPTDDLAAVLRAVAAFDDFTADNDPFGEHDCACFVVAGYRVLWKIDYYDAELNARTADAADPSKTCRVLTIMLAEDY